MGIGEKKTPNAFVKSCEIIHVVENLEVPEQKIEKTAKKSRKKEEKKDDKLTLDLKLINKAFDMSANESEEVYISTIGFNLVNLIPVSIAELTAIKPSLPCLNIAKGFVLIDNVINGLNHPLLKR